MLINKPVFLQATAGAASHLFLALIKDTARRTYVSVAAISLVIMWVRICTLHDYVHSRSLQEFPIPLSILVATPIDWFYTKMRLPIPPPHNLFIPFCEVMNKE
jgi:hypothetical protein